MEEKNHTNAYLASQLIKDLQIHYAMNITSWEIHLLFHSAILILAKGKYHTYDQKFMYKVIHLGIVLMILKNSTFIRNNDPSSQRNIKQGLKLERTGFHWAKTAGPVK